MNLLLKIISFIIGVTINSIIIGFTFSKMWAWFIVPLFQLPSLRIVDAIGIIGLAALFKIDYKADAHELDYWTVLLLHFFLVVVTCIYILLFGWIVSSFL
jgi:hypothetical protein